MFAKMDLSEQFRQFDIFYVIFSFANFIFPSTLVSSVLYCLIVVINIVSKNLYHSMFGSIEYIYIAVAHPLCISFFLVHGTLVRANTSRVDIQIRFVSIWFNLKKNSNEIERLQSTSNAMNAATEMWVLSNKQTGQERMNEWVHHIYLISSRCICIYVYISQLILGYEHSTRSVWYRHCRIVSAQTYRHQFKFSTAFPQLMVIVLDFDTWLSLHARENSILCVLFCFAVRIGNVTHRPVKKLLLFIRTRKFCYWSAHSESK